MSNSISRALAEASEVLKHSGVPEARREAASLLAHVLNADKTYLIANAEETVDASVLDLFRSVVNRRARGEPSQYITGTQDFYGRTFAVSTDVLIPRPETECLIEAALEFVTSDVPAYICDVGTGSGCIAITLLLERPLSCATAVDISDRALEVARRNAITHGVTNRISLVQSDCFSGLKKKPVFDLILSNPPYVSAAALPGLQREVRDHEPIVALSPGEDGLTVIRRLLTEAPAFLHSRGRLLMEIGFDQSEAVRELIDQRVWRLIDIKPDLQQIPRIVVLERNG